MANNNKVKQMISTAAVFCNVSVAEIARSIGILPQSLYRKMKYGNLKPEELKKIASKLGAEFVFYFSFPNGSKIGNIGQTKHSGITKIIPSTIKKRRAS